MYTLSLTPSETRKYDKRKEAVKAAKRMSRNRRSPVKLLRADGWERMIFHDGSLLEGTYVTRDRRNSARKLT